MASRLVPEYGGNKEQLVIKLYLNHCAFCQHTKVRVWRPLMSDASEDAGWCKCRELAPLRADEGDVRLFEWCWWISVGGLCEAKAANGMLGSVNALMLDWSVAVGVAGDGDLVVDAPPDMPWWWPLLLKLRFKESPSASVDSELESRPDPHLVTDPSCLSSFLHI
jgi:hypothetical protein